MTAGTKEILYKVRYPHFAKGFFLYSVITGEWRATVLAPLHVADDWCLVLWMAPGETNMVLRVESLGEIEAVLAGAGYEVPGGIDDDDDGTGKLVS